MSIKVRDELGKLYDRVVETMRKNGYDFNVRNIVIVTEDDTYWMEEPKEYEDEIMVMSAMSTIAESGNTGVDLVHASVLVMLGIAEGLQIKNTEFYKEMRDIMKKYSKD